MNKKATYLILALVITGLVIFRLTKRKMSKTQRQIVFQANAEADKWEDYTESDIAVGGLINQYWCDGVAMCNFTDNQVTTEGFNDDYPWSAAFISWIMLASGAESFPASASHSNYVIETTVNREADIDADFTAWDITEQKPEPSDIVCKTRAGSTATYGNVPSGTPLHCDIVTKVNSDSIEVVGGNLSNKVKRVSISLNNEGFVDEDKYFVIIKNRS